MDTSQNRDFMQGTNNIRNVSNSRDAMQQHGVLETEWSQSKTGTSCRDPTALRTSPTAGMPAATRCARISIDTSKNRNFMQGVNSIKKVSNSRDASSNMVSQKQHRHKQKQGLHVGANSIKNVANSRDASTQQGEPETAWTQAKTGT
jgi:hypothetical protein